MRGPLAHLRRNRFYIGEVAFKGENLPGEQPAIVDRQLFNAVKLTQQVDLIRKPDQRGDAIVCGLSERFSCQSRQPKRRAGADGLMSSGGRKFLRARWQRRHDRASGSIRSTQTRRHFANLTGKSSATARDGNPSRSVTTFPS
jgi:hypothetical protein